MPPEVTVHTSSPAVDLLYALYFYLDLMLDMDRAREVFEDSEDFTVGIEEEFQILDPETLDLVQRFEELRDAAKADPPLAESITGRADRVRDRDPLRQGRDVRGRRRAAARRAAAAVPARGRARRAAGAPPARTRGARGRSSGSSTPRTTAAARRGSSTSPGATTRSRCTSTSACAAPTGRSPSATTCARCCPDLLALSANSPFLDGRDSGLHSARTQIFTKSFPRCGVHEPFGDWASLRRLRGLPRRHELDRGAHAALVERAAAPRLRHRRVPDLRRADARRGLDRAGRPDHRLHRPGGARLRRRRAAGAGRRGATSRRTCGARSATAWTAA